MAAGAGTALAFGTAAKTKKVIILHGYAGNSEQHWQNWLYKLCQNNGLEAHYPQFATPEEPKLDIWLKQLSELEIDENTSIVCHSLGCALILQHLLRNENIKAGHLILVAPATPDNLEMKGLKKLSEFYEGLSNGELIKLAESKIGKATVIHSGKDEYANPEKTRTLISNLQAAEIIVDGGHLGDGDKRTQLPEVAKLLELPSEPDLTASPRA